MKDFDDEDLEFDDDLPELDLSDLDLEEEEKDSSGSSKKYELKKYEEDLDDSEDFAALIQAEAFKALDVPESKAKVPSTLSLDEEESDAEYFDYDEDDFDEEEEKEKPKTGRMVGKILLGILLMLIVAVAVTIITPSGRKYIFDLVGSWIYGNVNRDIDKELDPEDILPTGVDTEHDFPSIIPLEDPTPTEGSGDVVPVVRPATEFRSEDYVKTYLLFGIEEIGGAANTDAILLMSVNTKDNTIKLTSIMRDTYVEIPGYYSNKINSVYAHGLKTGDTLAEQRMNGGKLLTQVIEKTFNIEIEGFACVNFRAFQDIVDRLGGIDLELGKAEASYLRTTNYISNPSYRTVQAGWNHMNGNQVLGYCRVRKIVTLGGENADYGRTLRHRRVINAIVQQYKSLPITDMYSALKDCLGYIITDLNEEDFSTMLKNIVENKTFQVDQLRLPIDGKFKDSSKKGIFNGKYTVTYALVLDKYLEDNIKALHEFVFLDGQEEAATDASAEAGATPVASPSASPAA